MSESPLLEKVGHYANDADMSLNDTNISVGAFTNIRPIELEMVELGMAHNYEIIIVAKNRPSQVNLREFFESIKKNQQE